MSLRLHCRFVATTPTLFVWCVCCTAGFSSLRSVYVLLAFKMSTSLRGSISYRKFFPFANCIQCKRHVAGHEVNNIRHNNIRYVTLQYFSRGNESSLKLLLYSFPEWTMSLCLKSLILYGVLMISRYHYRQPQALSEGRRVKRRKGYWHVVKQLHFIIVSEDCVHLYF